MIFHKCESIFFQFIVCCQYSTTDDKIDKSQRIFNIYLKFLITLIEPRLLKREKNVELVKRFFIEITKQDGLTSKANIFFKRIEFFCYFKQ